MRIFQNSFSHNAKQLCEKTFLYWMIDFKIRKVKRKLRYNISVEV